MKILVDARLGWGSGIGRVVANILPRLAARMPQHDFTVLVGPADGAVAADACQGHGNIAVRLSDIRPFSLAEQWRLPRMAGKFDLTWFTNYWVPLAWRGRFVVTVHDLLHLEARLFPTGRVKRGLALFTFHKVRVQAAGVMFDSRFTQRAFEARIGLPQVGRTIHLGADHLAVPRTTKVRDRRILVVAAAKPHKNFKTLLAAWNAADVSTGWTLTIVTPDDILRTVIDLDAAAADRPGVEVLRGITDAALADLYTESAIVALPSLYEGFGLPLLEGLRSGAWCICSTAESMVEIAEGAFVQFVNGHDVAGWTGAIEHATRMVEDGAVDLQPLLDANRRVAERFRWDETARGVAALIEEVAGIADRGDAAHGRAESI